MGLRRIRGLLLALLATNLGAACAHAQSAAPYFAGKTVTIVVGSSAGGTYDLYAHLLARYLGKYIPGRPTTVVDGMPGADGETGAAFVARQTPKDGTYIAATTQTQPLQPILQNASKLNYDPSRVNYLGTPASDVSTCIVRHDAPATTFADMFKTPIIMGGTAPNGPLGYLAIALNNVLGTKFKQVLGYPGANDIVTALLRGEVQGVCGLTWSALMPQYAEPIKNGTIKVVVQVGDKGLPELDEMGVPLTASYAQDDKQRDILDIIGSQGIFARPYFVAAEVPADHLSLLRRAFAESWRDPDLVADAAKAHLNIAPISGEDIQSLLQKIYASPSALLKSVKEAIELK